MNKVDILSSPDALPAGSAAAAAKLSPSPQWRPLPRAAKLMVPVWGYSYVRQFLQAGVPTLLAPGNLPAVARMLPTEFIILTSTDDEPYIREHAMFKRLAAVCPTHIHPIDHLITDGNYSTTITLAYAETVRRVGDTMTDTCFFFLVSDYIYADGSLANALKRMLGGTSAVVVGNFQVAREDALPWLEEKLRSVKYELALAPRELMQWALNHLHPATLANMINIPLSHNSHTNRLFWRVDGNTILGRFYLMHMLCIRPEHTDFVIAASCDYSFVPEMCPSGNVDTIADSDEYLVIEMQPRDHEWGFLQPGPLKPRVLAKSLREWTTSAHRANADHSLIFHAADLPPQIEQSIVDADAFVADVASHIGRPPLPYRNHPYWRGAMAAFNDAVGHRIQLEEWPFLLALPDSSSWFTHWLFWRAKRAVTGTPPHVLPWHPLWPDFRTVLRELEPFFVDSKIRILMVSNEPTIFTLAFADNGERVNRLRCSPFLQSPPERFEPMHGKFDLCLLELSEGDMRHGDELIDRIVPLMKKSGRVILFVSNQRPLSTARRFSDGVTHHVGRFIRSGALPTEIQFVRANRLRWFIRRRMVELRSASCQSAWIGIPVTLLGGVLLMCLAFIGNLDVLLRNKRTAPRGIASSFVMRLSVDAPALPEGGVRPRLTAAQPEKRDAARADVAARCLTASGEHTREVQYARCVEVKNAIGLTTLGLMTNQVWYDDPRRLTFLLARYKFVSKMLSGRRNAGEIGCGDAFGTRIVLQEVPDITVYDFDPVFIEDIRARRDERWPLKAEVHDIVSRPLPRKHESLFSLDVIEHIAPRDEHAYLDNLRSSLIPGGILIVGTPSIESQAYASPLSKAGHVNCKSGKELKILLQQYFSQVLMFSMNDEVVHTGFYPMAHYLFAVCVNPK